MLAKVTSAALVGLDAHLVDVEVDISGRTPAILGRRVARCHSQGKSRSGSFRAKEYGLSFSRQTDHRQSGSGRHQERRIGTRSGHRHRDTGGRRSDSSGDARQPRAPWRAVLGRRVKPITGGLSFGLACRRATNCLLPAETARKPPSSKASRPIPSIHCRKPSNSSEAINVTPSPSNRSLLEATKLRTMTILRMCEGRITRSARSKSPPPEATRAMVGPPGSGKTMLARRLPPYCPCSNSMKPSRRRASIASPDNCPESSVADHAALSRAASQHLGRRPGGRGGRCRSLEKSRSHITASCF